MSVTETLLELRTAVRNATNYRAPFITDPELTGYINDAIRELSATIATLDESRLLKEGTLSVVAAATFTALPADCAHPIAIAAPSTSQDSGFRLMERLEWRDRYRVGTGVSTPDNTRYAVRGSSVYWWPLPAWTDSVKIDYIPDPVELSLDADSWDGGGLSGWARWVVLDAMITCGLKAVDETAGWERSRERIEQRFAGVAKRDRAQPQRVPIGGPDRSTAGNEWRT